MPLDTELIKAAYKGDVGTVENLLSRGHDVNETGAQDRTSLHRSVGIKSMDLTKLLLEKGAAVNARDSVGRTPLHWSVIAGSLECSKILVERGAEVNPKTVRGQAPLCVCPSSIRSCFLSCSSTGFKIEQTNPVKFCGKNADILQQRWVLWSWSNYFSKLEPIEQ